MRRPRDVRIGYAMNEELAVVGAWLVKVAQHRITRRAQRPTGASREENGIFTKLLMSAVYLTSQKKKFQFRPLESQKKKFQFNH